MPDRRAAPDPLRRAGPSRATVLVVVAVTAVAAVAVVGVTVAAVLRSGAADGGACRGLGRAAATRTEVVWATVEVAGHGSDVAYQVSQPMEVPVGGRGLRVDAVVFGSRNAPIFPDPVVLDIVAAAELDEALQRDALQLTTASPAPGPAPQLQTVGAGIKGVNEDVAVPAGTYRLVSAAARSALGPATVRVCR